MAASTSTLLSVSKYMNSIFNKHLASCVRFANVKTFHSTGACKIEERKVSDDVLNSFRQIVGEKNVLTSMVSREQYSTDESCHGAVPSEAVIIAQSTDHVSEIAKICSRLLIPMIPHGTGTGLAQGIGAIKGGVCIDLSQMTNVLNVNAEDFDVTVESGVTWRNLNNYLRDTGLMFTVDPGSEACLGGMAATGASGTNAVRYGTMKQNVLNLEVVLADGTVFHTAGAGRRARKSSAGYNLTDLFVGSEGTLGFITKATLRLHAIPEKVTSAVCSFPTEKDAVDTVVQILQSNIPVAKLEFMDDLSMEITNKHHNLNYTVAPSLFLEFHGMTDAEVDGQSQVAEEIITMNNGSNFMCAKDIESRNKLWHARHNAYYSTLAQRPGCKCITTDVCVPITHLVEMIIETKKDIKASGVFGTILGHVGDGNFHAFLIYEPKSESELRLVQDVERRLVLRALSLDGTCTGEHGIGTEKIQFLKQEMGDVGIDVMKKLKLSLDPKDLMNPGKIFTIKLTESKTLELNEGRCLNSFYSNIGNKWEIAKSNKSLNFMCAKDTETRNKLWHARYQVYYSTLAQKPGYKCITTDVCVPITSLAEMIVQTKKDIQASGVFGTILGHVGDGNFHTLFLYEPQDESSRRTIQDIDNRLVLRALSLDGTCTGEHGVGTEKIHFLEQEVGKIGIQIMKKCKLALDPKNLMNPGKIFNV